MIIYSTDTTISKLLVLTEEGNTFFGENKSKKQKTLGVQFGEGVKFFGYKS